jgi:putative ABC transport system permease protein
MKFLPFVWSGLWRKPGRTVLIFLQVSVAFALFGMLQGLKSGAEHLVREARADLLLVHGSLGLADALPLSLLEQIKAVPGVQVVAPVELFLATYQKPDQRMVAVAIPPVEGWPSAFTFAISPQTLEAFRRTRTAAIVKARTAQRYGWKVGDHIPLQSSVAQQNGSTDWAFDVVGTFTDTDIGAAGDSLLINYTYFDEARASQRGTVAHYNVAIAEPSRAAEIADEIDRRFANSSNETRTESLRELAQAQMQSIGDLNFLIRAVLAAVFVALLFATCTMMVQSTRERAPELAVLKTLGFSDRVVFLLILGEAIAVFVAAAACGLALATVVFPLAAKFVPGLSMPFDVVALGLASAAFAALISASVPAIMAARSDIPTALAGL